MIELGPVGALLRMVGGVFWVVVVAVLLAALLLPKTKKDKAIAVAVVLGVLALFPGRQLLRMHQEQTMAQTRLAEAERRFQAHCKTAGEFIHKTVENVDGILLMKLRPSEMNSGDQFRMDDPYGRDLGGDGYIESFLRGEFQATHTGTGRPGTPQYLGYTYVEAVDPQDGKRYRYTGRIDQPSLRDKKYADWVREFVLDKTPASGPAPRYGVTYDDISTREDRDYWIAGSSLKVIDLSTNEVMAERIGYMMDLGQGNSSGGRSPWLFAADHACPEFYFRHGSQQQPYQTLVFVEKVLKPKLEK